MCGISGTTRAGVGESIAAMNHALRHRGPDDEGVYIDKLANVGLGVRRLSVIDVAGGHQPVSNEDQTVWAVLNGEIYNHSALRQRLQVRGHTFMSKSDTEVLVHAYEDFGDDLVHALEGMFAFAIWDGRRRRMLLARDRFGEKPLFYSQQGGALTFASELTALRAGGAGGEVSPQAIDAFFVFGYIPGPGTILGGVQQLPPGHCLSWEQADGAVAVRGYWAPLPMPSGPCPPFRELVEETQQLLEESVRSRLIADVPLGLFLSGGVDSTLVTALAARNSSVPVKTFTIGYDVGRVNELKPARRIAATLETDHHETVLTLDDVKTRVPDVLAALDQPIADQALVASHALAQDARREVTVAVGGEGADELFGGYPRYQWLAKSLQLQRRIPAVAHAGAGAAFGVFPLPGRAQRLRDMFLSGPSRARHFQWVTGRRPALRSRLYGPRLRSELAKERQWLEEMAPAGPELDGEIAGILRLDQTMWLPDDVLAKADRASMLVSLEVRTPYLDRRLAEFAFTIPAAIHCDGQGKSLLRAVLAGILPETWAGRPKAAFRVPSAEWLRGPLATSLSDQLRNGRLYRDRWFDGDAVTHIAREHQSQRRDWSSVIWPIYALGVWMDRFAYGS
jgi:asparagine synthase (glutamine-hydrolysing)